MTDEQTKQTILGFTEFFKGITGNQNLEIPSEIAEKYGIQAQADGKYISRLSEADGILEEIENVCFDNEYILDRLSLARNIIQDEDEAFRQLSSKAILNKTGHWIWDGKSNVYRCSCCNQFPWRIKTEENDEVFIDMKRTNAYKFCPNCGAKMVEPQESEDKK